MAHIFTCVPLFYPLVLFSSKPTPLIINSNLFLPNSCFVLQFFKRSCRQNCLKRDSCRATVIEITPYKDITFIKSPMQFIPIGIGFLYSVLKIFWIKHTIILHKIANFTCMNFEISNILII